MFDQCLREIRGEEDSQGKGIEDVFYRSQIITGEVLVTRNPCHFTSDLQRFTAVDNFEVRQQFLDDNFNVIVFSSKGTRP